MKNFSFYWNWLARVAKLSSVQRKAVVKSTTSKTNGKTAILTVATIVAVALTTQTTGPSAQSTGIPELPDLPHPGLVPEPALPPFPPGAFNSCIEQYYSRLATIGQGKAGWEKGFEKAYETKSKPFVDAIKASQRKIADIKKKIAAKEAEIMRLQYSRYGYLRYQNRINQLYKEIDRHNDEINDLILKIVELRKRLARIGAWYDICLNWLEKKTKKEEEAAWHEYLDCLNSGEFDF